MKGELSSYELRIPIASDSDILTARAQVRTRVLRLGFATTEMVRIVTAVSELARNMLMYAGNGMLTFSFVEQHGRQGVQIVAQDNGPGIPDVDKALLDGFSTSGGLGLGLPGARRLMDEFRIVSKVDKGTTVTTTKWLEDGQVLIEQPRNTFVETGWASRARSGESDTGDKCVIRHLPGGVLFAVVDGLGHGPEAAQAAQLAVDQLNTSTSADLVSLVQECHRHLQKSRGVVMTVVSIDAGRGKASWLGVGNVRGMLAHAARDGEAGGRDYALLRSGIVGQKLPSLQPSEVSVENGDTFVIGTDGVGSEFMKEHGFKEAPQAVAERMLERYSLGNDDALVLVVRYRGR